MINKKLQILFILILVVFAILMATIKFSKSDVPIFAAKIIEKYVKPPSGDPAKVQEEWDDIKRRAEKSKPETQEGNK